MPPLGLTGLFALECWLYATDPKPCTRAETAGVPTVVYDSGRTHIPVHSLG